MDKQNLSELLWCTVFALYGSIARTLADNRDRGVRGWALVWLMSANAVISGFCGFLSAPLSQALHLDGPYRMFFAGVAGYMGLGFLALAENFVKGRMKDGNPPADPPAAG